MINLPSDMFPTISKTESDFPFILTATTSTIYGAQNELSKMPLVAVQLSGARGERKSTFSPVRS